VNRTVTVGVVDSSVTSPMDSPVPLKSVAVKSFLSRPSDILSSYLPKNCFFKRDN
jgi:hypothetical protein